MRLVQLANFYGPRSGGLRTALHHLGAGYTARGHEVVLVVPGPRAQDTVLASGVRRITVPAPRTPAPAGTGWSTRGGWRTCWGGCARTPSRSPTG